MSTHLLTTCDMIGYNRTADTCYLYIDNGIKWKHITSFEMSDCQMDMGHHTIPDQKYIHPINRLVPHISPQIHFYVANYVAFCQNGRNHSHSRVDEKSLVGKKPTPNNLHLIKNTKPKESTSSSFFLSFQMSSSFV